MSRFVIIKSHRDLPLAELSKLKLESEGIPCHLSPVHHVGIDWRLSQALGGVKVYVHRKDEEIAKNILKTDESSYLEEIENCFPEPAADDMCQNCGSLNICYINRSRFWGTLILLIINVLPLIPLFIFGVRYKCKDCGHKMKPL